MTSYSRRPRMPWSGATGAIARCKNRSIGYARKTRSVHDWHWTCGEKPKAKGATKPSTLYMKHVQAEVTRYPRYSLCVAHLATLCTARVATMAGHQVHLHASLRFVSSRKHDRRCGTEPILPCT